MADMLYDVIVVGAGPGGSSAATFLALQGLSVLLLDKHDFPRDKVCGDGLTPQAVFWLDVVGCVDQVLAETNACITAADLYVDGEHILTGTFPQDSPYPGFCTLLTRRKLDYILLQHAVSRGARVVPGQHVRRLNWHPDSIEVEAASGDGTARYRGRLVVGADGANSVVSRAIGNELRSGLAAVSVRTYYDGVRHDGAQFRLYFLERFFPGYGWVFVDDSGRANVGLGYASDGNFARKWNLKRGLQEFIDSDLKDTLAGAQPVGKPAGWWSSFARPRSLVADRVLLIGDAANLTDPMNGGGIHKAMESAYWAAQAARYALAAGDVTATGLAIYERRWREREEIDWRTSELIISLAKNPDLRELYLYLLKSLGRLSREDPRVEEFCAGVFIELTARSACLSPLVLLDVIPLEPRAWLSLLRSAGGTGAIRPAGLALGAVGHALQMGTRILSSPRQNVNWGMEIVTKAAGLAECYASERLLPALSQAVGGPAGSVWP